MSQVNVKLIGGRVAVKPVEKESVTSFGIIIPEKYQEDNYVGVVVAVGSGTRLDNGVYFPVEVEVGDKVLYSRLAGAPFEQDGETYLVINEGHILAVFPAEAN